MFAKPVDSTRPEIEAPAGSVEIPKHEGASIGMSACQRTHSSADEPALVSYVIFRSASAHGPQ
jgi:hypothetical protein